ncbi:hypothetical protein Lalb_Chr18g0055151 [Lupinus albus]|uniref:Uncharacterized protein n=1 Tax=Lupinus albus TaxID=3870 RepID=A0A6A4P753_LUPAL|nr:hypothetical protein Lalb_Chr18g0055151 [Lupinus albus]
MIKSIIGDKVILGWMIVGLECLVGCFLGCSSILDLCLILSELSSNPPIKVSKIVPTIK